MLTAMLGWVDARFPLTKLWEEHLAKYYAPKNFDFWYYFGSLALLMLVLQIVTGIFLTMHYKPDADMAFASVEYIMRDVPWGWLIRYLHSTGASFLFIVVYLHMFRGMLYGSFKPPRELIWLFGMFIYLILIAEAFTGYLLPWGQMSYWGAQVIVNLFGAIPVIGEDLAVWIRGDFVVSDATLNRFFSLHVIAMPLVLVFLVIAHIMALHEVGSNNPDGVEIKKSKDAHGVPVDGIPFHPYYTVKDIFGVAVFLIIFAFIVFFIPELGGYFLEHANFEPANPLVTPEHIAPVWYFTPFYTVLRAIPDKFFGLVAMTFAIGILIVLPWIDRNPIKSVRYRSTLHKINLIVFAVTFVILGYLGVNPPKPVLAEMGLRFTEVYFLFFLVLFAHSKPRSRNFAYLSVILLLGLLSLWDIIRIDEKTAGLILQGWLIPGSYLAAMMLLPHFTNLNREETVPPRVTS